MAPYLAPKVGAELLDRLGFLHVPAGPVGRASAYLLVALRRVPTLGHYDPETVDYWVSQDGRGIPEELTCRTPVPLETEFSWGTIRLTDRLRIYNEYLTFGGDLLAERIDGTVVAVFRSPAPLLLRGGHSQGWDYAAQSVAAFFGRLRADVGSIPGLESALAEASPVARYAAYIADQVSRFRSSEPLRSFDGPMSSWLQREEQQLRSAHPQDWAAGLQLAGRTGREVAA